MKRTGNSKLAVVGWGRGMGHTGHMYLADAVITQAGAMKADPYFFVSKTVGKDDPLYPEEKLAIYKKVFPQYANIFTPEANLNQALQELAKLGYQGVVLVVGADQKEAFKYLEKPNKEGVPVYQSFGFKKLKVISRQETRSKFRGEEGPRATPMRQVLLDPNASDEQKFEVWRRDMPSALSDDEVMDLMQKAAERLSVTNKPKAARAKDLSAKIGKLKEAILSFRTKAKPVQKKDDSLGYKHLFKQPGEEKKPEEKRFHGWQEYEKQPETVEEARIIDPKALINAYYVSPKGARHKVAEKIPYYLLDKLIPLLTKKYAITMHDIEVRPADVTQYKRSSHPELAEEGMDEGYIFKGGFPFDVDHMPGSVIRNRDETTDIVKTKNKDKWDDMVDIINDEVFDDMSDFRTNSEGETVTGNSAVWAKWDNRTQTGWINRKGQPLKPWPVKEQEVEEAGITRRGILKGIAGAGALGAAGKAGAIAGAFPSPSTREKWAKDAAASNAAEARRQAELKAKADKERLAKNTPDVERLNKVSYHGDNAPEPSNATWDGDSSFLDLDGTQYSMASRMPIRGDVPPDMKLIVTQEGRQVYIWTRNGLTKNKGHYFYPAEKPKTIDEDYLDE